jgi:Ca2+-binding RTX toxin-like protein
VFSGGSETDSVTAFVDFGTAMVADSYVTSQGDRARLRSIEEASVAAPTPACEIVIDASRFSGRGHLEGGAFGGDDILIGGSGPDALFGLDGNDELSGGPGRDALDGGSGTDACDGGSGADSTIRCELLFVMPSAATVRRPRRSSPRRVLELLTEPRLRRDC